MRRESDPIIKRAEDKHTEFEAEKMRAQEAIDARRTTEAVRRGGGDDADTPPEKDVMRGAARDSPELRTAASSSSGAIGHITTEEHTNTNATYKTHQHQC